MIYREALGEIERQQQVREGYQAEQRAEREQEERDSHPFGACRNFLNTGITGCNSGTGLPFVNDEVTNPGNELGLLLEARELYLFHKDANIKQAEYMKACLKTSIGDTDPACENIKMIKDQIKAHYPQMKQALHLSQAVSPRSWGTQYPQFDYPHDFSSNPIEPLPDIADIKAPVGEEKARLERLSLSLNQSFLSQVQEDSQRVRNLLNNDSLVRNYRAKIEEERGRLVSVPVGQRPQVQEEIQRIDGLLKARREQLLSTPTVSQAVAGKWQDLKEREHQRYLAMLTENKLLAFVDDTSFDEDGELTDAALVQMFDKVIKKNQDLREEVAELDTSVGDLEKLYLQNGLVNQVLQRKPGYCNVARKGDERFKDSRFYQDMAVTAGLVVGSVISKPCDVAFLMACQAAIGVAGAAYFGHRQFNEFDENLTNFLYDLDGDGASDSSFVSLSSERRSAYLNALAGGALSFAGPVDQAAKTLGRTNQAAARLTGVIVTSGDDIQRSGRVVTLQQGEDALVEAYDSVRGNPNFASMSENQVIDAVQEEVSRILQRESGEPGSVMFLDTAYLEKAINTRGLPENVDSLHRDHHGIFSKQSLGNRLKK